MRSVILFVLFCGVAHADIKYQHSTGVERNACFDLINGVYVQSAAKDNMLKSGLKVDPRIGGKMLKPYWEDQFFPALIKTGMVSPANLENAKNLGIISMNIASNDPDLFFKNWNMALKVCEAGLEDRIKRAMNNK